MFSLSFSLPYQNLIVVLSWNFCRCNPIDFDAFDESGVDSASRIIDMFTKQNKRVMKVFDTFDDEDDTNPGSEEQVSRMFVAMMNF